MKKALSIFFYNCFENPYRDKQPVFSLEFDRFISLNPRKPLVLTLKSVAPTLVAFFAVWRISYYSIAFIISLVTLTKREPAILKFSAPAMVSSCEVIMARYEAMCNLSEQENLCYDLGNFTKACWFVFWRYSLTKSLPTQITPSPEYPVWHVHWNDPLVLVQLA